MCQLVFVKIVLGFLFRLTNYIRINFHDFNILQIKEQILNVM